MNWLVKFSRYATCFIGILFLFSCAHDRVSSRDNYVVEPPAKERAIPLPSPFALTVSRYPENSRLVAWGHIVWPDGATPSGQTDWALLVDKEMINYLLSVPLKPEVLEKVGDNSAWSPYLLRWKSPNVLTDEEKWVDFVTSFQMPTSQWHQITSSGLPILNRETVENHLRLLNKIASFEMIIEGFTPVP
ncbi:MAG: hypothetical protein AAB645_01210 [Patescibacteria group bacterium]